MKKIRHNAFTKLVSFFLGLLLVTSSTLIACFNPLASPPPDYFPLKVGDWWQYQTVDVEASVYGPVTEKVKLSVVSQERQAEGTLLYVIGTSSINKPSELFSREWYSKPAGQVLAHRKEYPQWSKENRGFSFDPPHIELKNPLQPGDSWVWEGKGFFGVYTSESSKVVASETVVVPAGEFLAMKIETLERILNSEQKIISWYADGVGLVKSERYSNYKSSKPAASTTELQDYSFRT
ncbi:hypothetical protein [Acaryochloris sp. CCMEE 5410]|uniref:TapB family protein n=1 Tax=Acaryochloris sp. CCMEE 5410 TaxID=310037 RepID=UPI00030C48DE|nr:hypothetical protein [Acaryochloris sp. CCMEE 5410]KAI9131343.1 hypothetical protein ON05_027315 [Acaryochloris sp. CCMEE 5410]